MEASKKIKKIKKISIIENRDVYDITVNNNHNFFANGTLVHNCVEIGFYPSLDITKLTRDKRKLLEDSPEFIKDNRFYSGWQSCNLCEVNGKKLKSEEDFYQACRAASVVGTLQADYTTFPYLGLVSQLLVEQEALLGVSMTGMMDSPDITFDPEIQRKGAKAVLEQNEKTAKAIGINPCARGTCVKPAGCQAPNTLISTEQGILRLDEIGDVNGSQWQDHEYSVYTDSDVKSSPKFFINGEAKTKKILLDSGITLESTLNHKYRVLTKSGGYDWKRADQLTEGDMLPYSVGEYEGGEYQQLTTIDYKWNNNTPLYNRKDIKQPTMLNEKIAWFLGIYFGDGSNHTRSIRISGNSTEKKGFDKIQDILHTEFGIECKYSEDNRVGNRCSLSINSKPLISFLSSNGLLKEKSSDIVIPQMIRMSPKSVIESFLDGFATADGSDKSSRGRIYVTTSKQFADELVVVLRAIGKDCKMRLMPPTKTSFGSKMRYWIQERKGRSGNIIKDTTYRSKLYETLDAHGLTNFSVDKIIEITDSVSDTYDIEVDDIHCYLANSYVSHNTTSCVLGSSSGIHPHHARRYFRRVQANKLEFPLQEFIKHNPQAVEESVWSNNKTDMVITFLCEVPQGAIIKNQLSAIELLDKVKSTQQNWVEAGTRVENCTREFVRHNVSNTITVQPDEWDDITEYIYKNRQWFAGISLLPSSGDKDYPQAPFTTVFTPTELAKMYGDASVFASGLVVDGLHAFDNNLWAACDSALGIGESLEDDREKPDYPIRPLKNGYSASEYNKKLIEYSKDLEQYYIDQESYDIWWYKTDWIRRANQFADRYFQGDLKQATYCMKDVSNWKSWCDLRREYKNIDWSEVVEPDEWYQNVDETAGAACAGGKCDISF